MTAGLSDAALEALGTAAARVARLAGGASLASTPARQQLGDLGLPAGTAGAGGATPAHPAGRLLPSPSDAAALDLPRAPTLHRARRPAPTGRLPRPHGANHHHHARATHHHHPAAKHHRHGGLIELDPTVVGTEGNTATFTGTFMDNDGNTNPGLYQATITWGDGTNSNGTVTGGAGSTFTVTGQHMYAEEGSFSVNAMVYDSEGQPPPFPGTGYPLSAWASIPDAALSASGVSGLSASPGTPFSGTFATFTDGDPGGTGSDYTASIAWGDGTNSSGTVQQTGPDQFQVSGGPHTYGSGYSQVKLTVTITDSGGSSTSVIDTVTFPSPPPIGDPPQFRVTGKTFDGVEGATTGTVTVAVIYDPDQDTNPADYTAAVTWGDGQTDPTSSVVAIPGVAGFFWVQGAHTYAEEGSSAVTVSVTDTDGQSGNDVYAPGTAFIRDGSLSFTNGAGASFTVSVGAAFNPTLTTFTDADPNGLLGDYSGLVDWGDGSPRTQTSIAATGSGGSGPFTISGSHVYAQTGTDTITFTILDHGASLTGSDTVTVLPPPLQVTAANPPFVEGASATATVATFTDRDGDTNPADYTAQVTWDDGSTTAGTVTAAAGGGFQVAAAHNYPEEGNPTFTVNVSDRADGDTAVAQGTPQVADAALHTNAIAANAYAWQPFQGAVASFGDADPNGILGDYSATIDWGDGSHPTGGTILPDGNSFWVAGNHTYNGIQNYTATVTIKDGGGSTATATTTVAVARPPAYVTGQNIGATEGQAFSGAVGTFTPPNPDPGPSNYPVTIAWGDGGQSAGTLTTNGQGAYIISGSHIYAEETNPTAGPSQPYTVLISVGDNRAPSAIPTQGTSTASVGDAPLTAVPLNLTVPAGTPTGTIPVGKFTDANPQATSADFTATVNWGDGSATTTGTVQPASGGGFQVVAGHTYAGSGSDTIQVTVTDDGGQTTTISSPVTVSVPLNATEGSPFSGAVVTLSGTGPVTSATIDWGDHSPTSSGTVMMGPGGYTVSGTHTWAEENTYVLTITGQLYGGGTVTAKAVASVADARLTPTGLSFTVAAGSPTGSIPVGKFTDANPQATAADFTAKVNWGDGSATTPATVQAASGGGFQVMAGHVYTSAGTDTIVITVTDDGGQTTTINSTVTVTPGNGGNGVTATEGTQFAGAVVTFTGQGQVTAATIDWGDQTTPSNGTVALAQGGGYTVSGSHTWSEEQTYTITVTAQLAGGGTQTAYVGAKVGDASLAPQQGPVLVGLPQQPLALPPNQVVVATFSDSNPQASQSDFSAQINWGDGSAADAGTVQAASGGTYQVLGNHTYTAGGAYSIRVTINDDGGSSATATASAAIGVQEGQAYPVSLQLPAPGSQPSSGTAYTAVISWGDGQTTTGDVTPVTGGTGPLQLTVAGAHVYNEEGSDTVKVTVTDPTSGAQATQTATAVVLDAPLAGDGQAVLAVPGESTGLVPVAGFTDDNTAAATKDFSARDFTASINWGDGSSTTTGTVAANADGSFKVLGSHTYMMTGAFAVTTTIADEGGQSTVARGTAAVVPPWSPVGDGYGDESGGGGGTGTGTSSSPDTAFASGIRVDGGDGPFLVPVGEASVDLNQGALRLSHPLDFDQSPGTAVGGDPALVYNSATVNVRPVIQLSVMGDPAAPAATSATVTLTWNGVAQAPVTLAPSGQRQDALYTMAVQVANPVAQTGAYPWSASVTLHLADGTTRQAGASGGAYVVARDGSPYGAGWGIDGVSQLVVANGSALLVTGAGDSRYFPSNGQGGFVSPPDDFGTLVAAGSGYTYVAKDQTQYNYSAGGLLSSVVDTHGVARSYSYDAQGRLAQVQAPDGGITTPVYDSGTGLLDAIAEPGGRLVQLAHDASGNLTGITDVDGTTRTFAYDTDHYLTEDQWAPLDTQFSYYVDRGLLISVDRGQGSIYGIASAAGAGLAGLLDGPAWATITDGRVDTTSYLLDRRGHLLQQMLPDGATTTYQRDLAGQVTLSLDGLHHPTLYTYAYGPYNPTVGAGDGDLVGVAYADGSYDLYRYDPTFHHQTFDLNARGEVTGDVYDPSTGDLLARTDAAGATTTYAWAAGLLLATTDPRGFTRTDAYDAARRLIAATDNQGVPTYYGYDGNGNPAWTRDPNGFTFTVYNPRNLLLSSTDAVGAVTSQTYNPYGEVTSQTNAYGATRTITYDVRGLATAQTDYLGNKTALAYDAATNLVQQTDPDNHATAFRYDADNREVAVTDALNTTSTTAYDADSDVVATTDPLHGTTVTTYDVMGQPAATLDPMRRSGYTLYDAEGNAWGMIDGRGLLSRTYYDPDNRPAGAIDPRGDTTRTLYDADGNVAAAVDGLGQTTAYAYNADDRQTLVVNPDRTYTGTTYDLAGDVVATTDARGRVTLYSNDADGRPYAVQDPDGNVSLTLYDAAGNVGATVSADGGETDIYRDADGRPTVTVTHILAQGTSPGVFPDPTQVTVANQYDPAGNVTWTGYVKVVSNYFGNYQIVSDGPWTATAYDADNQPVLTQTPTGWDQTGYNADGEVVANTDADGHTTQTGYDGDGEVVATRDADGHVTGRAYNADGEQVGETDADANGTRDAYDGAGNPVVTVDAQAHATVSAYDQDNRLVSRTDRDGRRRAYTYDPEGRVLSEAWYNADGSPAGLRQYAYDAAGNLTAAADGYGSYAFTYDSAGLLLTQRDPLGLTLTYGHDGDGNVTSVQDSLGGQQARQYNSSDQLTGLSFAGPAQAGGTVGLHYRPDGLVSDVRRGPDTAPLGDSSYAYDAGGRLTGISHQQSMYEYSYDAADRLTSESDHPTPHWSFADPNAPTNYGYDPAGQLTSAGWSNYTYDANGNRSQSYLLEASTIYNNTYYTVGPDNRLASDGTWNYTYDNEGNVVQKANVATRETWNYTYDLDNHLTGAVHKDASGNVLLQVTEKYDVFGQRVEEDVYTPSTGQTTVQRFAYDADGNAWAQLDGSNNLVYRRLYVDINGQVQPMARLSASGSVAWYQTDHLGSVRDLLDNSGNVLDHIDYDPWGNVTYEMTPANGDVLGYAGGQYSAALGMTLFGARWYDATAGRWTSEDPLGLAADSNPYRYAGNGPTDGTDPSGLEESSIGTFFGEIKKGMVNVAAGAVNQTVELAKFAADMSPYAMTRTVPPLPPQYDPLGLTQPSQTKGLRIDNLDNFSLSFVGGSVIPVACRTHRPLNGSAASFPPWRP